MNNLLDAIIAAKLAGGGGGGGGGSNDTEFITLVPTSLNVFGGGTWTSNKAFSALASAFDSGASIHVIISNLAFDAAQLTVYQRKGNTLYAHVRFYDGDQINGEFRIFQDGTYAYLDSIPATSDIVTPSSIITATGQMTDGEAAQVRENIGAVSIDEIGTVFTLKGSVATVADLPATGNTVGDVYYVEATSSGYIWMTSTTYPNGYWEELGETIDLSAYQLKPAVNAPTGASVTIAPADNNIYNCGTLTSLTITDPPATGSYSIVFTSGSTATTTSIPATILGLENFAPEANTIYEINVLDNRAVVGSWEVSA